MEELLVIILIIQLYIVLGLAENQTGCQPARRYEPSCYHLFDIQRALVEKLFIQNKNSYNIVCMFS